MPTIINAPEEHSTDTTPSIFLAGGTQHSHGWRKELCDTILRELPNEDLVVYNPELSSITDWTGDAIREQFLWEHKAIELADVFQVWFCASNSTQPMSTFELGKVLTSLEYQSIVIGVEPGYSREVEVMIQTEIHKSFAWNQTNITVQNTSWEAHVDNVLIALDKVVG